MNETAELRTQTPALVDLLREQFGPDGIRSAIGEGNPTLSGEIWSEALHGPLSEFLGRPGKQFRSELVETSWHLAGGKGEFPERLGQLVEILHAGSLIVDDIEDGSPERRNGPSLHVSIGTPLALNTGNWLYFWAFALVEQMHLGPHLELGVYRWLSTTMLRCHYGQALDLTLHMAHLEQSQVHDVVTTSTRLKTGCLMEFSAALGAIAAGANRERVQSIAQFGMELGVALQMLDDNGGLVSEQRRAKGYEDLTQGRPTWPWAWLSKSLDAAAFAELQTMARRVEQQQLPAEELARTMREHLNGRGRTLTHRHLQSTLRKLRTEIGSPPALGRISAGIWRLEQSYG